MATSLAHKMITNCNSSLLLEHSVTHIFFVYCSVCAVCPATFSFCRTVCSITYCFVSNGLVANSAQPIRLVLNELCGPPVG